MRKVSLDLYYLYTFASISIKISLIFEKKLKMRGVRDFAGSLFERVRERNF